MNVSVSSRLPEKGSGVAIFGSLQGGGCVWYCGERGRDAGKGTCAGDGCQGIGAAGVIGRGGTGNAKSPNWSCIPLTVAVSEET